MSSLQRGAYQVYRVLIAVFFAACLVQIFLAGRGVFGIRSRSGSDSPGSFFEHQKSLDGHRAVGGILGLVSIVMFLLALVVWRNKRLIGQTVGLAFATFFLQHLTAMPSHPWVAALHPVIGVSILGAAGLLAHTAWRSAPLEIRPAAPAATAAPTGGSQA